MKLLRYRGELMVAGVNARLRKLLAVDKVPARQFRAQCVSEVGSTPGKGKDRPPDHMPSEPSAPPLVIQESETGGVLYQSAFPPEIFQPESGWPAFRKVERWIHGEEGMA